jgi:hypothetical protein
MYKRNSGIDDIVKCLTSLGSIINLPHMNNVPGIVNTDYSKLSRVTTRSLGKVGAMLRANTANSSIAKACLGTDLSSRQTRVKQSNDMKHLR